MKLKLTVILFCCLTSVSSLFSTLNKEGVLLIPQAETPPIIDGQVDNLWRGSSEIFLENIVIGPDYRTDWFDCSASFRAMWDESGLYLLIKVKDDDKLSGTSTWEIGGKSYQFTNSIHLLFGSKTDELNIVKYGATEEILGNEQTEHGWLIECQLAVEQIMVPLASGETFNFNLILNDCNDEGNEGFTQMSWAPGEYAASLMRARLVDYVASDIVNIERADFTPVIDGNLDLGWLGVHEMSPSHYIEEDVSETFEQQIDWTDNWFKTRTLWDDSYLYIFMEAYDDVLSTSHPNPWENDDCELYFDGDNSKHVSQGQKAYDDNDFQYRKEINGNESGDNIRPDEYGFQVTENGWNMEFAFDLNKLDIPPTEGHLFGYDVQKSDNDDSQRSSIVRWWDTGHESWLNPSLFGTAKLTMQSPSAVTPNHQPDTFVLEQNYPNPFNPQTTIIYSLNQSAFVQLHVFDVQGRNIISLVDEKKSRGSHQVSFNARTLSSGIYLYELLVGKEKIVKKMMLLR